MQFGFDCPRPEMSAACVTLAAAYSPAVCTQEEFMRSCSVNHTISNSLVDVRPGPGGSDHSLRESVMAYP